MKPMHKNDKWRFPLLNKNLCHTYLYGKSIYKIYFYSVILVKYYSTIMTRCIVTLKNK